MNINHLPDDDLRYILRHFPLQTLLQLRLVCSHWQEVIEEICAAKRSLKIFASIGNVVTYVRSLTDFNLQGEVAFALKDVGADDDLLEQTQIHTQTATQHENSHETFSFSLWSHPWQRSPQRPSRSSGLSSSTTDHHHLSTIFPKVEQLTFFKHSFNFDHFDHFHQLNSLTLNCQFINGFTDCLQQLSRLHYLQSLHLLRVGFELTEAVVQAGTAAQLLFSRLVELSVCGAFDHSSISIAFLRFLGPRARRLTIKLPTIDCDEFAAICGEENCFRPQQLTFLSLDGLVDTELSFGRQMAKHCRFLELICTHFYRLQTLQIGLMREVTHDQIAPLLAQLTQLCSLTVFRHFWITEGTNLSFTLPTVKSLHIHCSSNSSSFNYASLNKFEQMFPHLSSLHVSAEDDVLAKFKHHLGRRGDGEQFTSVLPLTVSVSYSRLGDTIDYLGRHQTAYRLYIDELVAQIAEILRTWFRAKVRRGGPGNRLLLKLFFFFFGLLVTVFIKVFLW